MQDFETESLWSQITGECIKGDLEGARLTQVPAQHFTYAEFKRLYPNGVLLRKPVRGESGSPYEGYFASERLGIFGRGDNFKRLDAKEIVYGLRFEGGEVAVAQSYLEKKRMVVVNKFKPTVELVLTEGGGVRAIARDSGKKPYPVISAFWFAWASFFPETELIK